MNGKKIITWVDNLRGIAMIAVVLGHISTPFTEFIYSWHIPAFFFISGYLMDKDKSIWKSINKNFIRLILPYIFFSLIGLSFEYVKRWINPGFLYSFKDINFQNEIEGIFWWMDYGHLHHYGFVLWFLPALFWARAIAHFLLKQIQSIFKVLLLSLLIFLFLSNQEFILPFALDKGLISLVWVIIGYYYRVVIENNKVNKYLWVGALLSIFILTTPFQNLALKQVGDPLINIIYATSILMLLVSFFKKVMFPVKTITFFGVNSMFINILHPYTNNLSYYVTILLAKTNWIYEFIFSIILIILLTKLKRYEEKTKYANIVNWF